MNALWFLIVTLFTIPIVLETDPKVKKAGGAGLEGQGNPQ